MCDRGQSDVYRRGWHHVDSLYEFPFVDYSVDGTSQEPTWKAWRVRSVLARLHPDERSGTGDGVLPGDEPERIQPVGGNRAGEVEERGAQGQRCLALWLRPSDAQQRQHDVTDTIDHPQASGQVDIHDIAIHTAIAHSRHGRYGRAIRLLGQVLDAIPRDNALRSIRALNELGMACKYSGRFDDARAAYQEALRLAAKPGVHASVTADLLHNLAGLAHAAGDAIAAVELAGLGIAARRDPAGTTLSTTQDMAAFAAILSDLGDLDGAEHALVGAIAQYRDVLDEPNLDVAAAMANLGTLLFRRSNFRAAAQIYRSTLALKAELLGFDHIELGVTMLNLGAAYVKLSLTALAMETFRQAEQLLASELEATSPALLTCRRYLHHLEQTIRPMV